MTEKKDIFTIRRDLRRQQILEFLLDRYGRDYIVEDYEDKNTKIWKILRDNGTFDTVTHDIVDLDGDVEETITVCKAISRPFVVESDGTKKWENKFGRLYDILDKARMEVGNFEVYLSTEDTTLYNDVGFEVRCSFITLNAELKFRIGDVVDVEDFLSFTLNDFFDTAMLEFMEKQIKPVKRLWKIADELSDYYSPKWGVYPPD